jgi:rRNA-processing protein FCF1
MQRHVLYDANYDEELLEERKVAKELCYVSTNCAPLTRRVSRGC